MTRIKTMVLTGIMVAISSARAAERVIEPRLVHLRSGELREWDTFPAKAEGSRWTMRFDANQNETEHTLLIRQQDVKYGHWQVTLNGRVIGRLKDDEDDLTLAYSVAAGVLRDGANELTIAASQQRSDDIRIGQVRLVGQSRQVVLAACRVSVTVTDAATAGPIPARLTIVDEQGSMIDLGASSDDRMAVRAGLIYTLDGKATLGLRPGRYTIFAGRGVEYGVARQTLELREGESKHIAMAIRHEMPTPGYVSCDTHVHTLTHSGHGDASLTERLISLAGEQIELPIATDHNVNIDYEAEAKRIGARRYFTPVVGNEVTTRVGHFNAFPLVAGDTPPDWKLPHWEATFEAIEAAATPDPAWKLRKMVILNHGRDIHSNFRPFDPKRHLSVVGVNTEGWTLRANAMELLNSGALLQDPMMLYRDWFGLMNRGMWVTPIGSSDSHTVGGRFVGQGRTYIECPDVDPSRIDVKQALENLRTGRVLVSMGLVAEVTVDGLGRPGDMLTIGKDTMNVHVTVRGPGWTTADRVAIYLNGIEAFSEAIRQTAVDGRYEVVKYDRQVTLPKPRHDAYLVVVASGPGVEEPYWRIAKSYQPLSSAWRSYVMGSTGPVLIDANFDGRRNSAFELAKTLMTKHGDDTAALVRALDRHDFAVAAQAASVMNPTGDAERQRQITEWMRPASATTRAGFDAYHDAWARRREE